MSDLQIRDVSFSYTDSGDFTLHNVSLAIRKSQRVALLGPNGSGKTTILKLASGVLSPKEGAILLGERDIRELPRREIAQEIAVVPQYFSIPFAYSVEEIVMMGRTPFIKTFSGGTEKDYMAVKYALDITKMESFKTRSFNELSGGERQRVVLAMALAQQPDLLLLDEPTTHLDINHQIEMLKLVNQLNNGKGTTIIAAMHDLNLAAMYFNRLILLKDGQIVADGMPQDVLTSRLIKDVFSVSVQVEQHPSGVPHIVVLP
ncbi:ABC transporter ATP-binding protein [Chloroflexota bacterium]